MSAFALLCGRLAGKPTLRKVGEPHEAAIAPIVVEGHNNREVWTLLAYDRRRDELLAMNDDDCLAVTGEMRTRATMHEGAPSIDRFVIVRRFLTLPNRPALLVEAKKGHS